MLSKGCLYITFKLPKGGVTISKKGVLIIIAPEDFNDEEFLETKKMLEAQGMGVTVTSTLVGTCRGMAGNQVTSKVSVDQVDPNDFRGLVIVGGSGSERFLWDNPAVFSLVRTVHQSGKIVAAIGRGRHVLLNLGLFPGKSLMWGPPVEIKGNIIAGRPPKTTLGWSSEDFGRIVAEHLSKAR